MEYAGKTCDLNFMLPSHGQMETSEFTMTGSGAMQFSPSDSSMSAGSMNAAAGTMSTISSQACKPGKVSVTMSGTGSMQLSYFQDFNPCPIGLYVVAH